MKDKPVGYRKASTKQLEIRLREIDDEWAELQNSLMRIALDEKRRTVKHYTSSYVNGIGDQISSLIRERDEIANVLDERAWDARMGLDDD